MTQPDQATATPVEAARRDTIALIDDLTAQAAADELPGPPDALTGLRRKLEENTYNVLVAGEAKRGKSSLVNALIGRTLLPTDVHIATNQVFRVADAPKEAYRLRFEDGSAREIEAGDLPRYGSQAVADQQGALALDQIIHWIEVDVQVRFLPPGVRLLDTPGLGSLYAGHAQVTQRFVPEADAVIFVLDSERPAGAKDLDFLEMILAVTPNVFFIQTMIDLFSEEHWREIQRRNEAILAERFGNRLTDSRVWPISSENLRQGAETGDEDFVLVSGHPEVAAALQAFLFRVAGFSRVQAALAASGYFQASARALLARRIEALTADSTRQRQELIRQAERQKRDFAANWGPGAAKRAEVLTEVRRMIAIAKQDFSASLQPGGEIALAQEAKIDAVTSIAQANALGQALATEIGAAAAHKWRTVCGHLEQRTGATLAPFLGATLTMDFPAGSDSEPAVERTLHINSDSWAKFKLARVDAMVGVGSTLVAAQLLVAVGVVAPPVAVAGLLVVGIASLFHGWKSAESQQVKASQQELRRLFSAILLQIRRYFFDPNVETGRLGIVDEHLQQFEQFTSGRVNEVAEQKLATVQAEIDHLTRDAKLEDDERRARAVQLRGRLSAWDRLGHTIAARTTGLASLPRELMPDDRLTPATAGPSQGPVMPPVSRNDDWADN